MLFSISLETFFYFTFFQNGNLVMWERWKEKNKKDKNNRAPCEDRTHDLQISSVRLWDWRAAFCANEATGEPFGLCTLHKRNPQLYDYILPEHLLPTIISTTYRWLVSRALFTPSLHTLYMAHARQQHRLKGYWALFLIYKPNT